MKLFGLIGYPLIHSLSALYFTEKFRNQKIQDCQYRLMEMESITNIRSFIMQRKSLTGLNVTIPFKREIIPYLDELDKVAQEIGAVNCIKVMWDEETLWLKGFNTDSWGFEKSLTRLLKPIHKKALILGTGGSAKAAAFTLDKLGMEYQTVSREPSTSDHISYQMLNETIINDHLLIINTTPLGMFPDSNTCPDIPYGFITQDHFLFDLVYNPPETLFLKKGIEKGATVKNGLDMLYWQAEKSWEIWNSK